jgi:hypothetical protein
MQPSLDQGDFHPKNVRYLGELVDRGIPPAILKVRQAAQGNPSQLRQVTLTKVEEPPASAHHLSDFSARFCHTRIAVRFLALIGLRIGCFRY